MMIRLFLFSFLLCQFVLAGCENLSDRNTPGSYHVIGYVFGGNSNAVLPTDSTPLTHINYAFVNVSEQGEVVLEREHDSTYIKKLTDLRDHHPRMQPSQIHPGTALPEAPYPY